MMKMEVQEQFSTHRCERTLVVGGGRALEAVPWYRSMAEFLKRLLSIEKAKSDT